MKQLKNGQFYGRTNETFLLDGITLTDTEYTLKKVDWHYHENAYFTFILYGNITEVSKTETYNCKAGSLLFHNCGQMHYNLKSDGFTRGFHIEIKNGWKALHEISSCKIKDCFEINSPSVKLLVYDIFREVKINDDQILLSVESLLLKIFSEMIYESGKISCSAGWVNTVYELLQDRCTENVSLNELAQAAGIHPVHLSRDFPKYFKYYAGQYIRLLRLEKALSMFHDKNKSITEISHECGFSDQSHFIRCFREKTGLTPLKYRKLLFQ